ncbi:hypothetical protein ACFOY4_41605 [Actinomadura syzygii]|uniref:Uncharacterized protein n=1 Tax=Actinomadura syzygii TaxID=1427538 RepID=A0A5D0TMV1_9ACTN|nr:hypothetical protein [Actinomadura syzygii]TYC07611.1 hypothetical protein FXF65_42205 [Actinomadura syzygii]
MLEVGQLPGEFAEPLLLGLGADAIGERAEPGRVPVVAGRAASATAVVFSIIEQSCSSTTTRPPNALRVR